MSSIVSNSMRRVEVITYKSYHAQFVGFVFKIKKLTRHSAKEIQPAELNNKSSSYKHILTNFVMRTLDNNHSDRFFAKNRVRFIF